jgi:hypothetical protein
VTQIDTGSMEPVPAFDSSKPDCLVSYINLDDRGVQGLLDSVSRQLHYQGEYDQGDAAVLDWDQAMDLLTMARLLWAEKHSDLFGI